MFRISNLKKTLKIGGIFLLVLLLLSACVSTEGKQGKADGSEESIVNAESDLNSNNETYANAEPAETNKSENDHPQSDRLRVYYQNRDNFNPLNTFDSSGKAACQLLYRSLFFIDSDNILRKDLVEEVVYFEEQRVYEIELIHGATFSDSDLITADDCFASILTYRDNLRLLLNQVDDPENSEQETQPEIDLRDNSEFVKQSLLEVELQRLNQIEEIEVVDRFRFKIKLREDPDQGVLFALQMPILKQEDVNKTEFIRIGSGKYRVENVSDDLISLKAVAEDCNLQRIELVLYKDAKSAMRGLEDNQVDLVYLDENNYNIYGKLNLKNMISFPGSSYCYLTFGENKAIKDPEIKQAMRDIWQLRDDLIQTMTGYPSVNRLPIQYHDETISAFHLFEKDANLSLSEETIRLIDQGKIEMVLLTPDRALEKEWALALREALLSLNVNLEIKIVDLQSYPTELASKNYDLAFSRLELAYPMSYVETLETIDPDSTNKNTEEQNSIMTQLEKYFYSVDREANQFIPEDISYGNFIVDSFKQLNILGIGFEHAGMIFREEVQGIPNSRISYPYDRLEDIWVWR